MTLVTVIVTIALTLLSIIQAIVYAYFRDSDNRLWEKFNSAGKLAAVIIGGPIIWIILSVIGIIKLITKCTKELDGIDTLKQLFYKEDFKPVKPVPKPKPVVPEVVLIRNIKVEIKPKRTWFKTKAK